MRLNKIMVLAWLGFAAACAPDIETYDSKTATLDIRHYLNGKLFAVGTVTDYTGEVTDRFTVDMLGTWEGNNGTLQEDFTYDDGHKEQRVWKFAVDDNGNITGTAPDVVGPAKGKQKGSAVFMDYTLQRTIDGKKQEFTMDDRLYMIDELYVMNHTRMKKFGVPVAELNIAFRKLNEWN